MIPFLISSAYIFNSITKVGEYSWEDYIYSLPMRYTATRPFVILIVSTVLASQLSPFLLANNLKHHCSRRQYYLPSKSIIILQRSLISVRSHSFYTDELLYVSA